MKWPQTAAILLTAVSAAIIPIHNLPDSDSYRVYENNSTTKIGLVCDGCMPGASTNLIEFDLEILAAKRECGASHSVIVNNVSLPFIDWHSGVYTRSVIPIRLPVDDDASDNAVSGPSVNVGIHLQLQCLPDETSLLSVQIESISGRDVRSREIGFALSFEQTRGPHIIRLQTSPILSWNAIRAKQIWLEEEIAMQEREFFNNLDIEYRKLEAIDEQITHLKEQFYDREHKMGIMIVNHFTTCNSVSCYIYRAKSKLSHLSGLFEMMFAHHPALARHVRWMPNRKIPTTVEDGQLESHSDHEHLLLPQLGSAQTFFATHPSESSRGYGMGCPSHNRQLSRPLRIVLFSMMGIFTLLSMVFIAMRYAKKGFRCCNPQRRRERAARRAARREERKTRAAYRRAARRHKLKSWWSRLWGTKDTPDHIEKKARVISQERVLEDAMQNEITNLQRAHRTATDLKHDGAKQQHLHREMRSDDSTPLLADLNRSGSAESSSLRTVSTLPLYQDSPPSYEPDFDGDMTVVDGFFYTSSYASDTPASSITDCDSEISFGTGSNATHE